DLLAVEAPLALGSSDGERLGEVVSEDVLSGMAVDASEDLLAACLLLETSTSPAAAEARAVAQALEASPAERSASGEAALRPAALSAELRAALEERGTVEEILDRWRGLCDVNAETWAESPSRLEVRFLFGLCGALAMVEHSCRPNARTEWDAECRQVKLVAMEDLRTGQRVTRSYLDAAELLAPWPRRQELLLSGWGFRCGCARCVEESSNVTDTATTTEHLDLNRCAVGLPLDELVPQVRKAGKACQALGVPKVGTLQFLEGVLAKRRHANELLWLHGLGPPTPSEADEEEEEEEVTASEQAVPEELGMPWNIGNFAEETCLDTAEVRWNLKTRQLRIPNANVPAPMTKDECEAFKTKVHTELKFTYADATKRCASLPDLQKIRNGYFSYFKDERHPVSKEHGFTYDQLKDKSVFDPKNPKESYHIRHTEAMRKRCAVPLRTRWMVRSSQAYGWLPPIDDPKNGFGRGNLYHRDAMVLLACVTRSSRHGHSKGRGPQWMVESGRRGEGRRGSP
ncbi:unnamed protein product, partial [Durusdinium trenchii]